MNHPHQETAGSGEDAADADVPAMAVRALRAAQQQAKASGRPMVLVEDDELVRIGPEGRTVLRKVAPRHRVQVRHKRASS